MKKFYLILFGLILLLSFNFVSAQESTCIYFFYGDGCAHCARVEPVISELESRYNYLDVQRFEIYRDRSNMVLLGQYFDSYNLSIGSRGVPAAFIGETYFIGDRPIIENLESVIQSNIGEGCPKLDGGNSTGESGLSSPLDRLGSLSLLTVIGAALVDSINPCAIAVLLILMSALLIANDKNKSLRAGFAFTLSIYLAYFLFGLGLFSAIQISGLSYWFYKVIGVLAILIGLANLKDYFWYGAGGFVMEIPMSWRPKLKEMLGKVTSPFGAFLMGFVVCLFELPCTGGPYIVILGLLADRMTMLSSIPILLLYNLVFVLPLIIITLLLYFGFSSVESATKWKETNLRVLHLIAGVIMIILGGFIVFGLV